MNIVTPPKILKKLFKKVIWNIENEENKIFLTFDDCSDYDVSIWILEVLKTYNIKATFFCVGKYVEKNNLIKQILINGHTIGNHTYSHLDGFKYSLKSYLKDIQKCNEIVKSKYFRPPYGKITLNKINKISENYKIVMWDLISFDFDTDTSPDKCFENVKNNAKSGSIVVFHASKKAEKNLKFALIKTIEFFLIKGFTFDKL